MRKGCRVNRVAIGRNEVFVQVPEPIHVGSQEKGGVWKDFSTLSLCFVFVFLSLCFVFVFVRLHVGSQERDKV